METYIRPNVFGGLFKWCGPAGHLGFDSVGPTWADKLAGKEIPQAKEYAQISMAFGACLGTIVAALMGDWFGRRLSYAILCVASFAAAQLFFRSSPTFDAYFIVKLFFAGATTASFYGWLPLYLPELFPTGVRATGQGFGFNFGRLLAAVGNLQMTNLLAHFQGDYAKACSVMSWIYALGLVVIIFAPETKGKPLPD